MPIDWAEALAVDSGISLDADDMHTTRRMGSTSKRELSVWGSIVRISSGDWVVEQYIVAVVDG